MGDGIVRPIQRGRKLAGRAVGAPSRNRRGIGVVNFRDRGILNLIDIGSIGVLPEPWNTHAASIEFLLKFEPRDRSVNSANVRTVDAALWSEEGQRAFYIYRGLKGAGSSLYEQNVDFVRANFEELQLRGPAHLARTWFERSELVRVEQVHCQTLDQVLEQQGEREYHFLKIDTQGAEYEILRGAERYLKQQCSGLHLELFTIPLYKNIVLMPEVIAFLDGIGFTLAKTFPAHGSFDSQNDCIFLRRGGSGAAMDEIRRVYDL